MTIDIIALRLHPGADADLAHALLDRFFGEALAVSAPDEPAPETDAAAHLTPGKEYTVDRTKVSKWHTDVYLVELPGAPFNSVMFDDLPEKGA